MTTPTFLRAGNTDKNGRSNLDQTPFLLYSTKESKNVSLVKERLWMDREFFFWRLWRWLMPLNEASSRETSSEKRWRTISILKELWKSHFDWPVTKKLPRFVIARKALRKFLFTPNGHFAKVDLSWLNAKQDDARVGGHPTGCDQSISNTRSSIFCFVQRNLVYLHLSS